MADQEKKKRGRGRPPIPSPAPPKERLRKSIADLVARGGRRVDVRLEKPAVEVLDAFMKAQGIDQTTAINQIISSHQGVKK